MRDPEKAYQLEISKLESEVTELEAKLAVAVKALEEVKAEGHKDLCNVMKPYRPHYECHFEIADEALAQLNNGEVK